MGLSSHESSEWSWPPATSLGTYEIPDSPVRTNNRSLFVNQDEDDILYSTENVFLEDVQLVLTSFACTLRTETSPSPPGAERPSAPCDNFGARRKKHETSQKRENRRWGGNGRKGERNWHAWVLSTCRVQESSRDIQTPMPPRYCAAIVHKASRFTSNKISFSPALVLLRCRAPSGSHFIRLHELVFLASLSVSVFHPPPLHTNTQLGVHRSFRSSARATPHLLPVPRMQLTSTPGTSQTGTSVCRPLALQLPRHPSGPWTSPDSKAAKKKQKKGNQTKPKPSGQGRAYRASCESREVVANTNLDGDIYKKISRATIERENFRKSAGGVVTNS